MVGGPCRSSFLGSAAVHGTGGSGDGVVVVLVLL